MLEWKTPLIFLTLIILFFACGEKSNSDSSKEQKVEKRTEDTIQKTKPEAILPKEAETKYSEPSFSVDELMGKINPAKNKHFSKIAAKYTSKKNIYMRTAAYESFEAMAASAKKENINLKIISATRPFSHQKNIWEAKWMGSRKVDGKNLAETLKNPVLRAQKILEFSSMPGTSRHHWGTDIDLNSLQNSYFKEGKGKKIYDWLCTNAASYGFAQAYTPFGESRPYGYKEEKWHWSYTPISKEMTQQYKAKITDGTIGGFKGAEIADSLEIVKKYVLGVAPDCK